MKLVFCIEKIQVNKFTEEGIPLSYKEDTVVRLSLIKEIQHYKKKISFVRKNKGYYWHFRRPMLLNRYEKLPIKFSHNQWYHISGLDMYGEPDYEIFFYVNNDGKLDTYHRHRPAPW